MRYLLFKAEIDEMRRSF